MGIETIDGRKVAVFDTDNGRIIAELPPEPAPNPLNVSALPKIQVAEVPSRDGVGTTRIHPSNEAA